MSNKMYVLQHKSGQFFKEQNLYLGAASLTSDIDSATQMPLDEAETKYDLMKDKGEWKIFRATVGLRLGQESRRHITKTRRLELEDELLRLSRLDE